MFKFSTRKLAALALLIAIEVVLSRFLSFSTPIVKIGFAFLPVALAGMMYGPLWGAVVGGLGDFLGAIMFPIDSYLPALTVTAALSGLVYGLFLYKHNSWPRIILAVLTVSIALHLFLDTYWLMGFFNTTYWALLPTRIVKAVIMSPVQVALIRLLSARLRLIPFAQGGLPT